MLYLSILVKQKYYTFPVSRVGTYFSRKFEQLPKKIVFQQSTVLVGPVVPTIIVGTAGPTRVVEQPPTKFLFQQSLLEQLFQQSLLLIAYY